MYFLLQTAAAVVYHGQTAISAGNEEPDQPPKRIIGTSAAANFREKVSLDEQAAWDEYIKSDVYKEDKRKNVDWVTKTGAMLSPQCAPHYDMLTPGRAHLFQTHSLHVWSQFAEQHNITWTLAYGTLLGYVRQGDFIPHDVDIDLFVHLNDTRKVRDELPKYRPDLFELTQEDWWDGIEKSDVRFKYWPIQRPSANAPARRFGGFDVDMFPFPAYEEKNAVPGEAQVPPYHQYLKNADPFGGRTKASMAGSVIWVPKDPTVDLKYQYCGEKTLDDCRLLVYEMQKAQYGNGNFGPSLSGSQTCKLGGGALWPWWCVVIGAPVVILLVVLAISYWCRRKKSATKSPDP